MSQQSAAEVLGREFDLFLDQMETTPEGHRLWRELFFAQPRGFRPLTMSVRTPSGGDRPFPLVVFIHGGGWEQGHPNVAHPVVSGMRVAETLAEAGYAVAKISYRLSGEGVFPTQLHDCKAAVRYLRRHAGRFGIDPDRVAALGGSAGGHLALLLGMELPPELEGDVGVTGESSAVRAVVDWYGVTDLTAVAAQTASSDAVRHDGADTPTGRLIGGAVRDRPEAARRASPVTWVNARSAPCLIQHGTGDRVVPIAQARLLRDALQRAGVVVELDEIAGADHCFVGVDTAPILPRTLRFLDAHLRM